MCSGKCVLLPESSFIKEVSVGVQQIKVQEEVVWIGTALYRVWTRRRTQRDVRRRTGREGGGGRTLETRTSVEGRPRPEGKGRTGGVGKGPDRGAGDRRHGPSGREGVVGSVL